MRHEEIRRIIASDEKRKSRYRTDYAMLRKAHKGVNRALLSLNFTEDTNVFTRYAIKTAMLAMLKQIDSVRHLLAEEMYRARQMYPFLEDFEEELKAYDEKETDIV